MFCAGGNLGWMAAQPDREDALRELASVLHEGLGELLDLDVPIVAAVHGPAAGAGVSLALVADIAYAGRSANFTVAYTAVGLSPDGGCSWLLPRAVGHRRASELMLTNRRVDADEAAAIGLVTAVVDDAELDATARATAQRLASGPTEAFAATKRLLRSTWTAELDEQLDREAACIAELAGSPTGTEGVDAFLAKRPPDFP
jgi:2-(1,2-epoxy-1,2-dihydrophenyl)acetyl-CoA isomerase